jgi:long-chain acyl-CoA synthetase
VAIFLPNTPAFVVAFFGALKAGAVTTTISPLHREREVQYQLNDSGAQTIVALDSLCPIVQAVKEKTRLKNVIAAHPDDPYGFGATSTEPSGMLGFQQLIQQASSAVPRVELDASVALAALQYTGGTTGTAKGAMLTHRNLLSNALAFAAMIEGTAQDIFLTALPLFHIYGLTTSMTTPIGLGAEMVLLKFEPTKALQAIQQHKVTVFCGVPTMYQLLLANPELASYDLTSVRVCITGASSLPPQVQRRFMEVTGGFLAEGYGLTEASPVTHCSPADKSRPLKVGSIGLPLPDTNARIVDLETSKPLGQGMVGELAVKGPQVMKGYWQKPVETAMVLRDGWLLTGDIARMDAEGYFYITDRKKDLIKTKDYSVYPRELEDILYEHYAVKLCAVVGKPDALAGRCRRRFVVLKEGVSASTAEIMRFVNEKVAPYKAIREIEFKAELPLSGAGKVLRRMLKAEFTA